MHESVGDGAGGSGVVEELAPVLEGQVGGDDGRGALVALVKDLVEQVGAACIEGQVSDLEMQALERDILLIDESYGRDVVNLTIARGYVKRMLDNARVVKYLATKHADLLTEFQRIQEAASLEA
jgi:RepB plasmid partitioning protein